MPMCRERLERTFKVNIIGMFSLAQKAVQHMVDSKGGGNIINIASIQAYKPSPPILDYSCTKVFNWLFFVFFQLLMQSCRALYLEAQARTGKHE